MTHAGPNTSSRFLETVKTPEGESKILTCGQTSAPSLSVTLADVRKSDDCLALANHYATVIKAPYGSFIRQILIERCYHSRTPHAVLLSAAFPFIISSGLKTRASSAWRRDRNVIPSRCSNIRESAEHGAWEYHLSARETVALMPCGILEKWGSDCKIAGWTFQQKTK